MNILYIAYSCAPGKGSEDRIGWMIPITAAKNHRVWVLTREEHRPRIEEWQKTHKMPDIRFCYTDIHPLWKMLLRGRAYSLRLNLWHQKALPLARALCRREGIRLIHQITPVELRSIGDYGSIPGVQFVCGPVGGGEYIPEAFRPYVRHGKWPELVRRAANRLSLLRLKSRGILDRCSILLAANRETAACFPKMPVTVYPEVGICEEDLSGGQEKEPGCVFLAAGRLIPRKGHALLLDMLAGLPREEHWSCCILGEGPERKRLMRQCEALGLSGRVTFVGKVPFSQMEHWYRRAHVLVMPSLRETTGSVAAEAMARGLPVITMDRFGGRELVTEETGWLYETPEGLSEALLDCLHSPRQRERRGQLAAAAIRAHTWEEKVRFYEELYQKCREQEAKNDE